MSTGVRMPMTLERDVFVDPVSVSVSKAKGLVTFNMPGNIGSVALISHPHDARRGQIWGLRVDPEFRGRKIASTLMRAVRSTLKDTAIQEVHTYAANERTAHLMAVEFGDLPMRFGKRDHLADTIEPFDDGGMDEVIDWLRDCRQDECPDDPAGTKELLLNSALVIVDLRPRIPHLGEVYADTPDAWELEPSLA